MRLRLALPAAAVLAVALAPSAARADDVEVELTSKPPPQPSDPALVLKVNRPVKAAKLSLTAPDGRKLERTAGPLAKGKRHAFPLDAAPGTTRLQGSLAVTFQDGGTGELPLDFEVKVWRPLSIEAPEERLRLGKGELDVKLSAPAGKCEYRVAFDGKDERHGWTRFAGEPAGTWLTVSWPTHGEADVVLRILLTCYDADDNFISLELFPWKLAIPHEDVNFASGRADIEAGEAPKLDAALEAIDTAVRRYGKVVKVKLYVAGHTDTVGDAGSNRALSLARARAIAGYFRKKGVKIPIFTAGFGEDQPAVPTPDETDERRNRRAEYILAVQPPARAAWSGL